MSGDKKHIFPSGIDLKKTELLNARLQHLFVFPPDPEDGQVIFKSDLGLGAFWDGTAWLFFGLTEEELQKIRDLEPPAPQEGIVTRGTITFDSATQVDISGYTWNYAGVLQTGGADLNKAVTGAPITHNRIDALVGDNAGLYYWITGTENPNQVINPAVPTNRRLLEYILRTPSGSNTLLPVDPDLTIYVDKVSTGTQSILSSLAIAPLAGAIQDIIGTDPNGLLRRVPAARAGVYTTREGNGGFASGWSRILRITIDTAIQVNYVITFQVLGVTASYEKGDMWVIFRVDGAGDIITNSLQLFGSFTPSRYTLIKVSATQYELYVLHDQVDSLYSYRPIMLFGNDFRYTFYQQDPIIDDLPAGTAYAFTEYGGGGGVPPGGTAGQVLTKDSTTDGDASWQDPSGGGAAAANAGSRLYLFNNY